MFSRGIAFALWPSHLVPAQDCAYNDPIWCLRPCAGNVVTGRQEQFDRITRRPLDGTDDQRYLLWPVATRFVSCNNRVSLTIIHFSFAIIEPRRGKSFMPGNQKLASGESASQPTVFDSDGTLRRLGGDTTLLADLVQLYEEDSPALLSRHRRGRREPPQRRNPPRRP